MVHPENFGREPFDLEGHGDIFEIDGEMQRIVRAHEVADVFLKLGILPIAKLKSGDKLRIILNSRLNPDISFDVPPMDVRELDLTVTRSYVNQFHVVNDTALEDNLTDSQISLASVMLPPGPLLIPGEPIDVENLRTGQGVVIDKSGRHFLEDSPPQYLLSVFSGFELNEATLYYQGAYDT